MDKENWQQKMVKDKPVTLVVAGAIGSFIGSFINFTICMLIYNWIMQML